MYNLLQFSPFTNRQKRTPSELVSNSSWNPVYLSPLPPPKALTSRCFEDGISGALAVPILFSALPIPLILSFMKTWFCQLLCFLELSLATWWNHLKMFLPPHIKKRIKQNTKFWVEDLQLPKGINLYGEKNCNKERRINPVYWGSFQVEIILLWSSKENFWKTVTILTVILGNFFIYRMAFDLQII